ncbi:MAG TPA: ABC transporter permease [Pyrinomonadaceae bacterium]|nr:ABC transporter permease [Pyrinomonadaceae bacterium]
MKLFAGVLQDLRYARRILRKYPAFSLAIVVTVALGVAANATIFGVINAVLLEPLPYKDPNRLVRLSETNLKQSQAESPVSVPNFQDWQQQQSAFEQLAASELETFNLTGRGEPQRVAAARITANLVPMLGVNPALGRSFLPDDEKPGHNRVVLLSDALWQRQFGGDRAIVNQTIQLNGESYTVVGVMPPGFQFTGNRQLWVPFVIDPQKEPWRADRANRNLSVFGRLKPGATLNHANTDIDIVAQRLEQQHAPSNTGWRVRLTTFYDWIVPAEVRRSMLGLFIGVNLLLLIACANVANLLLAHATTREQEMAMRAALGASPGRLIRQLLIESLLLASLGGLLGLVLAYFAIKLIAFANIQNIARLAESHVDGRVLAFTFLISALTGVIFGLAPAWWSSRVNLTDKLKGGRSEGARGTPRLRGALVVAEVTMAAAVLVGAGLLVNMLARLRAVPLGFTPDNVFTMQISLPGSKYGDREQRVDFFNRLLERVRAVPGVVDAAAGEQPPSLISTWTMDIALEGADAATTQTRSAAEAHAVTARYFQTMRIPLLQGQDFANQYRIDQPLEFIVSESFARRYWPNESAIGKRFRPGSNNPFGTVVGVVGDVRTLNSQPDTAPAFYFPYGYISMPGLVVVARTAGPPETFAAALRAEVGQIDSEQPVYNMRTMKEIVANATAPQRFQALLSSTFAIVALLLVAVGIYSVVTYTVRQRSHEIGVRIAVGASSQKIIGMVIAQGMRNVVIGLVLGLAGSLALTRLIGSSVFGLPETATDLRIYVLIALLLLGVAFVACYLPAWRATKIDPSTALRGE